MAQDTVGLEQRCCTCQQVLPLDQFNRNRTRRNGRTSRCRSCAKAYNRQYHHTHREQNLARSKRWAEENPERIAAIKRHHYDANRDKAIARTRAWNRTNKERKRAWRAANRDVRYAAWKAWWQANPERWTEYQRRRRARKLAAAIGDITPDLLAAKLAYWGWRCWLCGDEPTGWDHVKPLSKGGAHMLANLRPACGSCNSTKHDTWPVPTHRRC